MTRAVRPFVFVVLLALLTGACASSNDGSSTEIVPVPTPLPTRTPIFIPTSSPILPTPTADQADTDSADEAEAPDTHSPDDTDADERSVDGRTTNNSDGPSSSTTDDDDDDDDDDEANRVDPPIPTAAPEPTATARPEVITLPTSPPAPTSSPAPTSRPAPTRVPQPARPSPTPVSPCAGGQVLIANSCSCPAGQTKRASDGRCTRLCRQADLTIGNDCVCTGALFDNGGQCVKRCLESEIPDGFGGCKPETSATN